MGVFNCQEKKLCFFIGNIRQVCKIFLIVSLADNTLSDVFLYDPFVK